MGLLLLARCGTAPQDAPAAFAAATDTASLTPEEYCADMNNWAAESTQLEDRVLARVNALRAAGMRCGWQGEFKPTTPLVNNPALRCAARVQALDMATRFFFAHVNPDGLAPGDRSKLAGYTAAAFVVENLAAGNNTANGAMNQWVSSPVSCANLMNPNAREIGVGFAENVAAPYHYYWAQTLVTPR